MLSNTIPTVQASLLEKGDNSRADINHITNSSIGKAVKYLWEKQSKPAVAILSNLVIIFKEVVFNSQCTFKKYNILNQIQV